MPISFSSSRNPLVERLLSRISVSLCCTRGWVTMVTPSMGSLFALGDDRGCRSPDERSDIRGLPSDPDVASAHPGYRQLRASQYFSNGRPTESSRSCGFG